MSVELRYFAVEMYLRGAPIKENAPAYTVANYTPYDAAQSVVAKCSDIVLDPGAKLGPTHWRFIGQDSEDGQVIIIVQELFA